MRRADCELRTREIFGAGVTGYRLQKTGGANYAD